MYNILVNYCHRGTFSSDGFYTSNAIREFCNVMIRFSRTITYLTISAGTPSGCASTYFLIPASRNGSCLARCSNLWTDKYKSEETRPKLKSTNITSKDDSRIKYILFKSGKMLRSIGKCPRILRSKDS